MESFPVRIAEIQPSQLYVCRGKLDAVERAVASGQAQEPVPIKELDGRLIFSDGHTRALAAVLRGEDTIDACWEDEPLDWDAYRVCVAWCLEERIRTVAELKHRVISTDEYERLWIDRCGAMQARLQADRQERSKERYRNE